MQVWALQKGKTGCTSHTHPHPPTHTHTHSLSLSLCIITAAWTLTSLILAFSHHSLIQTYIGDILIACNPYQDLGLYTTEVKNEEEAPFDINACLRLLTCLFTCLLASPVPVPPDPRPIQRSSAPKLQATARVFHRQSCLRTHAASKDGSELCHQVCINLLCLYVRVSE